MPTNNYRIQEYIDGVLDGSIVACKWVRLAVERHVRDIERQNTEEFPYHFDEEKAHRAIDFVHDYCKHVKGRYANEGKFVILEPWQQFITAVIFGWLNADGYRKYTTVFVEVAKKNGKSTWVAAIMLYLLTLDGESGPEIYSAATTKDQAKIVFNEYARAMVLKNPELQEIIQVYKHAITCELNMGSFTAIASENHESLDGKHVHGCAIDEYHAHKTDDVYSQMRKGLSGRDQGMLFVITTAGHNPDVPCVSEEDYAKRILLGDARNESYFGIVYTLDEGDDWTDERMWIKANPNLETGKPIRMMREDFQKAVDKPDEVNKFKNKHLNIWTQSQTIWIRRRDWMAVQKAFGIPEKAPFWGGVDLSKTIDTTAYARCFLIDGKFSIYVTIYLPDDDIDEREIKERVEWRRWVEEGHVILTPGRTVNYNFIKKDIMNDANKYDLQDIGYDDYNATGLITDLTEEGFEENLVLFPQTWKYMSPAIKDFQKRVLDNEDLQVYPNPCLDWMIGNTETKENENNNVRLVKPLVGKSRKHIDGVVAAVMALDRAVRHVQSQSIYESEEARESIII